MVQNIPFLIYGTISESSVGVATATVKARNETTNELLSETTDSAGRYIFDAANFTSGYLNGDKVTIYTLYTNFDGSETTTIDVAGGLSNVNIALSAVADSDLINYTTVQKVYDELDGKTASDISAARIINNIQQMEGIIDSKTNTSFKSNTATDETHTIHRWNITASPDSLDSFGTGTPLRADRGLNWYANRVKTNNAPIIAISSLSTNGASGSIADDWTELTEQTGSAGAFYVEDRDAGVIDFLTSYPRIGKRSWKVTYTWGHDPDSTDRNIIARLKTVERLCTLMAAKTIITSKSTGAMFDSTQDIRIDVIDIKAGGASTSQYLASVDVEIKDLWKTLGDLGIEII